MKFFFLSFIILIQTSFAQDNAFKNCRTVDDCVLTFGTCGEFIAINKSFLEKYEELKEKSKELVLCNNFAPPHNPPIHELACEKSQCVVIVKEIKKDK